MIVKKSAQSITISLTLLTSPLISSECFADAWEFSVGTGITALNMEGDLGIGNSNGSAKSEFDLDFDDILDLNETSGGLALGARKDKWSFKLSGSYMELEGDEGDDNDVFDSGLGEVLTQYDINFTKSFANFNVGYTFFNNQKHQWRAIASIRYYKHEWELKAPIDDVITRVDTENDWTDGYIGAGYTYRINDQLVWDTSVDAGAGDSDLSYSANTSLLWSFAEHWVVSVYAQGLTIDYEENSEGDNDWYLYDADEFGVGVGIALVW